MEMQEVEETIPAAAVKDQDLTWFYGRWAFAKDPNGKPYLWVEWLGYLEDEDEPRKKRLSVEEARED